MWLSALSLIWEVNVKTQKLFFIDKSLAEWSHDSDLCDIVLYHHSLLGLCLSHHMLETELWLIQAGSE